MSFWDKILRLLGTNRVRLGWRWRTFKEDWGKKKPVVAAPRARSSGSFIPEDFPLVTASIMGVCVLFYFLAVRFTSEITGESASQPNPEALVRYGATFTPAIALGEWWRTVTSVFQHGSLSHILMNMLGLWSVGTVAEDRFGRARTLVVFVVSGTLGMVASVMWHDMVLGVGASGAIFGLMGCVVTHAYRQGGSASARELRSRFIPWIIFALVVGLLISGTDNAAHIGGLVTGGLCGLFLGERTIARRVRWVWEVAAAAAIVAVAFAFYAAAQSPLVSG